MKKLIILAFLLLGVLNFALSQDKEALLQLDDAMLKASDGQKFGSFYGIGQNKNIPMEKIFSIVDKYSKRNNGSMQQEIAMLYGEMALASEDQQTKVILIHRLLGLCEDSLKYGCGEAASQLRWIKPHFFDANAKKKIINLLQMDQYFDLDLILLAGVLNLKELKAKFNKIWSDSTTNAYIKSSVCLALARMGNKDCIRHFVQQYKDDDQNLDIQLLKDLLYIKQPEVIPIFEKVLFSKGEIPSDDPDLGEPFADFGIYYLGLMLEGFPIPVKKNQRVYFENDIALAQKWMLEHKGKYKIRKREL